MKRYLNNSLILCVIGFIVSGIFGYLAFRDFQWNILKHVALGAEPWLLVIAGILILISILLKAYRWRFFLPIDKRVSYFSLASGVAVGYFFSNIFPGRMGDLLRPGYVSKANRQPFHIILYSIFIERIFEVVILVLISIMLFKYNSSLADIISGNSYILYALVCIGLIVLIFSKYILSLISLISRVTKFNFISKPIDEIIVAFEDIFKYKRTLMLICLTFLIIFLDGMVFVCTFDALHLNVSFIGKLTTMIATSLGYLIPSAPAGIGVFHYLCQTSLHYFGVDKHIGLSAAIFVHALCFICDFVIGVFFIVFGPLRMDKLLDR